MKNSGKPGPREWECKYHVVLVPKIESVCRRLLKEFVVGFVDFSELCRQKGLDLLEGKAMPDHVHMLLSVAKYSVAMTMGYLKGKSAVRIHRELLKTKGTLFGRALGVPPLLR